MIPRLAEIEDEVFLETTSNTSMIIRMEQALNELPDTSHLGKAIKNGELSVSSKSSDLDKIFNQKEKFIRRIEKANASIDPIPALEKIKKQIEADLVHPDLKKTPNIHFRKMGALIIISYNEVKAGHDRHLYRFAHYVVNYNVETNNHSTDPGYFEAINLGYIYAFIEQEIKKAIIDKTIEKQFEEKPEEFQSIVQLVGWYDELGIIEHLKSNFNTKNASQLSKILCSLTNCHNDYLKPDSVRKVVTSLESKDSPNNPFTNPENIKELQSRFKELKIKPLKGSRLKS